MIPQPIELLFKNRFDYPSHIIIAQVATLSSDAPDLRSMRLFDIDSKGRLIFLTNTSSHKWAQLSLQPNISILFLNKPQDTQIITRGYVELLTPSSSLKLCETYWHRAPDRAKQTYKHKNPEGGYQDLSDSSIPLHVPDNFGIIRVIPNNWEFLEIDVTNYAASHRIRYDWAETKWQEIRTNAI